MAVLLHALLGGVDDARAAREPEPLVVGGAIGWRDRGVERRPNAIGCVMPASVACVRWPTSTVSSTSAGLLRAFGRDALDEAVLGEDHVGLDAGLVGERLEQRIDQIRLAVGIDVDLARLGGLSDATRRGAGDRSASAKARAEANRIDSSNSRGSRPRYRT